MFRIRPATTDDAPALSRLIQPLARKFITFEFSAAGARTLLESMTAENFRDRIAGGFRYHVAELDGALAGAVGVRDNSHLYHLFVAQHFHGQGLGRLLWETGRDESLHNGNPGRITVNSSRYAVPFYRRLGFVDLNQPGSIPEVICFPMVWTLKPGLEGGQVTASTPTGTG
jgi:GNAT superfamily N-acetyltransferase